MPRDKGPSWKGATRRSERSDRTKRLSSVLGNSPSPAVNWYNDK